MLAKIIVAGEDRQEAIRHLSAALKASSIWGVETNLAYLQDDYGTADFVRRKRHHLPPLKRWRTTRADRSAQRPRRAISLQDGPAASAIGESAFRRPPMDDRSQPVS